MLPKTIRCTACGIEVTRVQVEGKPSLEIDAIEFNESCVEPSVAREPFRCPSILSAAINAGLVGRDGLWIGQLQSEDTINARR
jgi:hypothetical protein